MKSGVILLVDDSPDDIELALHAFRINGIANPIVIKQDGEQALNYLLDPAEPLPALVLLDINLPKVSGLQALETIRRNARTCLLPVVMLTTSRHERDVRRSYAAGANSYIVKPLDFTEFSEVIREVGHYWLELNEHAPRQEDAAAVPALVDSGRDA